MPKLKDPDTAYSHRRMDGKVHNITIDEEADEILRRYCQDGRKNMGKFIARLLYEHEARVQERQRIRAVLHPVLEEPTAAE